MDQRARKLSITGAAVALFVGFIFLTRWTGDSSGSVASFDDGQKADLAGLCMVLSSDYIPYETVIRVAAGQEVPADQNPIGAVGSRSEGDFLQGVLRNVADSVPDAWASDAHKAAEGIERAFDGNLTNQQIEDYVRSFKTLQRKAAKDCKDVKGVDPDFGRRGPFGGTRSSD